MVRILAAAVVLFVAGTVRAQVNTYQYQTEEPSYSAEVLFSRGNGALEARTVDGNVANSSYQNDSIQLGLNGNILPELKYKAGVSFLKRSFENGSDAYSVSGLSDVGGSLWALSTFDTFILDYGISSTLSVAPARFEFANGDGTGNRRWRNNYSGYNSYRAFVGSNFAIGQVDAGVRGNLTWYQSRISTDTMGYIAETSRDKTGVGGEAFMEVPMYKGVRVGISTGFESSAPNFDSISNAEQINSVYSSVYGKYKYDTETSFILGVASQNKSIFYQADGTDLTLGVARSL